MHSSTAPVWMRGRRPIFFYVASTFVLLVFFVVVSGTFPGQQSAPQNHPTSGSWKPVFDQGSTWQFDPTRDSRNLGLTDEQCDIAFPKLYTELDRARDHLGPNSVKQTQIRIHMDRKPWPHAQVQVLIHTGQMYIIDEMKGACDRARALAGLSSLYRAIIAVADPATLPNVEFVLDLEDTPTLDVPEDRIVWAWNRPVTNKNTWVAPDFDGWAFPNPDLGSYTSFRARLALSDTTPFGAKIPKAAWRGGMNNAVRTALLSAVDASANASAWADVRQIGAKGDHRLHMGDFCAYQFPVHTEGVAWSGRLRYLQNCASASVVHQPLRHHAHYYDLLVADGPAQNYIRVRNDFADLPAAIAHYQAHPADAERVARNSAATFRDRYLTPAAEACYWRRMLRHWAEVQAFSPEPYVDVVEEAGDAGGGTVVRKKQRGVDWEVFAAGDPHFKLRFEGYGEQGKEKEEE